MAVALGKRKRREDVGRKPDVEESSTDDDAAARALFQRAFEAKFRPLEKVEKPMDEHTSISDEDDSDDSDEDDEDDEDDEWDGLSEKDDEATPEIEVIQDKPANLIDRDQQRREMKAFMSSKPPTASSTGTSTKPPSSKAATGEDDETETTNLKNDLALQRLLKESHLLDATTFTNTANTAPEGKSRLKALDMRIRDLGGKKSHLEQDRIPMSHRRGMVAKSSDREAKRRQEAKENGIILERVKGGKVSKEARRERGIGGPSVGKFGGATLRLSKDDIRGIQSSGERRGGKKGKRGGKR